MNETKTFTTLGISARILDILSKSGFITPTPIQHKVIPVGISGKDVIGIAQTGTGKTLGFGIPMLERILQYKDTIASNNKGPIGLVVLPTRELASQVDEVLRKIGGSLDIRTAVLIGGDSMYRQKTHLRTNPHIIIATPGRLIDHIKQRSVSLNQIKILVLDEADHMFDIGFAPQIREILKSVPKERQTMLFSATMPDEISRLAMEYMSLPLRIEVAPAGTASETVEQEIIVVNRASRFNLLMQLLPTSTGPVLVFTRTKHGAKEIASKLRDNKITSAEIHSNRSLGQRRQALDGFKTGRYRVLVATDIAARGIDVKNIELVINYDLPEQKEDYVHRIGRTGRAGMTGKAISFAMPDQRRDILAIEKLINKPIPKKSHENAEMNEFKYPQRHSFGRRGGRPGGFRSGGHRGPGGNRGFRGPSGRGGFRDNGGNGGNRGFRKP